MYKGSCSVSVCVCLLTYVWVTMQGYVKSPGLGIIGGHKSPSVDSRNQTQSLGRHRKSS